MLNDLRTSATTAALIICSLSGLTACTGTPTNDQPVTDPPSAAFPDLPSGTGEPMLREVFGDPRSTRIELGVNTCNENPRAQAQETADVVRIEIILDRERSDDRNDCADSAEVLLRTPLGDRQIIDVATGEAVPVAPLE